MAVLILDEAALYPIRPSDFPRGLKGKALKDAFSQELQMEAAATLIRECQKNDLWKRFIVSNFSGDIAVGVEKLVRGGWLIEKEGWIYLTSDFVDHCCAAVSD